MQIVQKNIQLSFYLKYVAVVDLWK